MNINPNQAMFQAEYFRNLYADQNVNDADQIRPDSEPADDQKNERDIAIISEEARRLQRSTIALGSNESSLDQQREMLIPSQAQTELQPQAGLDPQVASENPVQQPAEIENNDWPIDNMAPQADIEQQERTDNATDSREPIVGEELRIIENLQDNSSVEANISNVNRSSQLQAYASAANVTQASMIVNFKV